MAFNYVSSRKTADKLVEQFGQSATLVSRGTPTHSTTNLASTVSESSITVKAALLDYTDRERAGTMIQSGDRKAVIGATSTGLVRPKPDDRLTVGSVTYRVVDCTILSPAGVDVVYICQVRR